MLYMWNISQCILDIEIILLPIIGIGISPKNPNLVGPNFESLQQGDWLVCFLR